MCGTEPIVGEHHHRIWHKRWKYLNYGSDGSIIYSKRNVVEERGRTFLM